MLEGTGLALTKATFPDRVFDVGIAEPHAVTMAAGMAAGEVIFEDPSPSRSGYGTHGPTHALAVPVPQGR